MRKAVKSQPHFGQTSIEQLEIDPKCRDDIPALLTGLRALYLDKELREKILTLLAECISKNASLELGRPGMDLWRILVLGVVRLGADIDYDRLHDLANKHFDVRVMLMTGGWDGEKWMLGTIKENVRLLTPEILDQINQVVVQAGHTVLKKKDDEELVLHGRGDSFVVETDVHYPTDINLLYDAVRKIVELMMWIALRQGLGGWRQGRHLIKRFKKLMRKIDTLKKSVRKSKARRKKETKSEASTRRREKREKELIALYSELIALAQMIVNRAGVDLVTAKEEWTTNGMKVRYFLTHARRQIDQIERRVFHEEKIPPEEKVFSVFEPHTEWIYKGKAGVSQELGVRVSILEDQYGFILNHVVMERQTDDKVGVPIVEETKKAFPNLVSCSFDKGYYSPENQQALAEILEQVILPKKGKLNTEQAQRENSEVFRLARNQHSAVESAINCLEHHGLDRCLDHGMDGFKRYVSLAVLSRNIHQLGRVIRAEARERQKRQALSAALAALAA